MNKKTLLSIAAVALIVLAANVERLEVVSGTFFGDATVGSTVTQPAAYSSSPRWSDTQPRINLRHIFAGEINRSGKPVGFHSRPGGADPPTARVVRVQSHPNRAGVYTATVEIRDGTRWKKKFSSLFPDDMTRAQVIDAIVGAYRQREESNRRPWRGPSGLGFEIQGYTLARGDINTAFPVFERD